MAVSQFIETSNSRSATLHRKGKRAQSTLTVEYLAFGTSSDTEVHNYVNEFFSTNRFYEIGDYTFMVESYTLEYVGDQCFRVVATYTKDGADNEEQDEPLRRSRSFETSGGTMHITQAEEEFVYSASGPTGPSQFNAIGVDGDSVAGVDITIPSLQWTESYDVPSTYVTPAYIKGVAALTGTVNDATFRTFQKGEVLFVGCNGNQEWDEEKGDGPWRLSFKFVASPNRGLPTGASGPETAPKIEINSIQVTKSGHDYLWVRYEDDVDDNTLLKKPKHIYVNKVYRDGDFDALGIGS